MVNTHGGTIGRKMRYSKLFTKTIKDVPSDEAAKNAQLLIQAGYIHKEMAGVYAFLPLGLKVVEKIKSIVREEMNALGGQELLMTNLQPRAVWQKTGRWDDKTVDIWFKTTLKDKTEVGLAWSHEEPIVQMMKRYVTSYKDLPVCIYQFQNKLRNELRAKSGIMRGREFLMKDMYSLSTGAEQHDKYYNSVIESYKKIYDRLGIGKDTYVTFASGGAFTQFSHEFQTICDVGEDVIYLHKGKNIAINDEVLDAENLKKLGIERDELEEVRSSEVGNIFNFGTDKSEKLDLSFTDEAGNRQFVYLGSYGIGITRLMGVLVEKFADDKGIIWPENVAPFKVYLAVLGTDEKVSKEAEELYQKLQKAGVEVLFDDRDVRPGEKFADADLLGIPYRVVTSEKSLESGGFELKKRTSKETQIVSAQQLLEKLK